MLTVIGSVMAAASCAIACWTPALKLAGAASAAASNSRLIVMPPEVTGTAEAGSTMEPGSELSAVHSPAEKTIGFPRRSPSWDGAAPPCSPPSPSVPDPSRAPSPCAASTSSLSKPEVSLAVETELRRGKSGVSPWAAGRQPKDEGYHVAARTLLLTGLVG